MIVISPSESVATIASTLNAIGTQQNPNQFGTQRYEILFQPGTYGSTANPLDFQVGYYESVEGLGQNPSQVVINGTIDSWNQCTNGVQTECYATDNFWRSISNLTINVTGLTGCFAGEEVWAASQAAPMRRVDINGNVTLMDFCDGSPDWASGGFIADSELNGTVENGSQQQYVTRNTDIGSWTNGVWNQVFCGDPGAPGAELRLDLPAIRRPRAVHDARHLPDDPGRALPVHRLLRQLQRVRPLGADQLQRTVLGQRQHPGNLALGEQHLLHRELLQHDHHDQRGPGRG